MNETEEAARLSLQEDVAGRDRLEARQREFLALLSPALPKLSRFCRAMCRESHGTDPQREHERAKDLASETILKAWENFERVREPKAFLSYLFTVASRINRHERVKSARLQPFSETDLTEIADERNAPDAAADVDHLYAALAKLPAKQREAIVMNEIVGLKLEEVAEAQGASLSAVKTRVSRGKRKLAKLLGVSEESSIIQDVNVPTSASRGKSLYRARFAYETKDKL